MEQHDVNYIADIDTLKDSWRLKVRVVRLWKITFQMDMIIMDERGDKIQASVKKALFPVFDGILNEGIVVFLNKFGVGENNGKYPLIRHRYKINFYRSTSVKTCLDSPNNQYLRSRSSEDVAFVING